MAAIAALALALALQGPPPVAWIGQNSRVVRKVAKRIDTPASWANTWLTHIGARRTRGDTDYTYYNKSGIPEVDFKKHMVIAVFGGPEVNNAGYAFHSLVPVGGRLRLRIMPRTFQTVGTDPDGGAQHTTPYGMFLFPRSAKIVIVEEPVFEHIGKIKDWVHRATLPRT